MFHSAVTGFTLTGWLKKSHILALFFVMETIAFAILALSVRSEWMPALLLIRRHG